MRISTKLALLAGFSVISIGIMAGTVRADESNQTKISLNIPENALTINQTAVCSAGEIALQVSTEEVEKKEEVKKEEKIIIETKKIVDTSDLPKGKFTINASAYTASADECGKSDGITASGKKVKENETIACPKSFAFGTKINIEGYGTYICQDRGGAIKGNKIDIYVETKAQAFAFGRRNLVAEVVIE
jgi:3D (Asp-Asp-Asp) domain-containing protein